MRGRNVVKRWATLAIVLAAAAFLGSGALAQFGYFGKNKVQYKSFDWSVYRAPHFDVHYYPEEEEFLEWMVSNAESAYLYLSQALDHEPTFRIPLIYYLNHGDFEQTNITLQFIPESVGAFAEPLQKRMVLPIDQPPDKLYALFVHELTHIFEYSILYQDSTARSFGASPPLWLMEGLASHLAKDEDNLDVMVIRDAVVSGLVPPITKVRGLTFLTYRYGHAAFDFIEQEFGAEGIRNFLTEYRKILLSANIEKSIKESFGIEADEFDRRFKRYLRQKYLPILLEKKEPEDHGREIGIKLPGVFTFSPALSPSGELIAVMTNKAEDLDIFLINARDGEVIRNLTKGFTNDYDGLTTAVFEGKSDLSWSPGGDEVAVFARKGNERHLLLFNAVTGKKVLQEPIDVDEAESPAFSPDGERIVFAGNKAGRVDIFEYNLKTKSLTNITNDRFFDSNPSWSDDGQTILYNRRINAYNKIFLLDYADPSQKTQVTFGETSEVQPSFSHDGQRIYYSSDAGEEGIFNIYSLDLETGEIRQYTDVISGQFSPRELPEQEGVQRVVSSAYWGGRYRLYTVDLDEPVRIITPEERVAEPEEIVPFEPTLKLTVDESEKREYDKSKFHIETVPAVGIGVASDGTIIGDAYLVFSDLLGDRRIWINAQTISSFSNFNVGYVNQKRRLNWLVQAYDSRDFVILPTSSGTFEREEANRVTVLTGGVAYPFSTHSRVEANLGVVNRDVVGTDMFAFEDPNSGATFATLDLDQVSGTSPFLSLSLINDTTAFKSFGPWRGRRVNFSVYSAPSSTGDLGTYTDYRFDFRAYGKLTSRSLVAFRLYANVGEGDGAQLHSIGGIDQIRGYRYREFLGDRAAFMNIEVRFPLVDDLRFPFGSLGQIRGLLFFDVGAAWTQEDLFLDSETGFFRDFDFWDSKEDRLQDGRASYGLGFSFRLGLLELNWTFARRLPFADTNVTPACFDALFNAATFEDAGAALASCPLVERDDDSLRADFWIGYAF